MMVHNSPPATVSAAPELRDLSSAQAFPAKIALLTGCQDKSYAVGLALALAQEGAALDFIGSDDLDSPDLRAEDRIRFLNLRGDQDNKAGLGQKVVRILFYYLRLLRFGLFSDARVFHILWNDKFPLFDRTVLKLCFRLLGRRLVFTAHNVNAGKRDGTDSWINRLTLWIQYHLVHHIFVHTEKMKSELVADFGVASERISVIPLGINSTLPESGVTREAARSELGLEHGHKTMLFFGRLAPYKGLEFLVEALGQIAEKDRSYRLVVAGPVKGSDDYWHQVRQAIHLTGTGSLVIQRIEFIPDAEVERFFKAADVLVLPYTHIFQSGLLALGYNFGLPVIAADVGSLKEDIVEGETGFVCVPRDPSALARTIEKYFDSDLYRNLSERRASIRAFAQDRLSWTKVGRITRSVYKEVLS